MQPADDGQRMRWWVDDSDFQSDDEVGTPDVFVFGGIAIQPPEEARLAGRIAEIKSEFGHARAPIKWNFKDARKYYESSEKRLEIYEKMRESSATWRELVFDAIAESELTIIVATIAAYSSEKEKVLEVRADCARRAFANGLMRFALHAQKCKAQATVILDWPASNERAPFNLEYRSAFGSGQTTEKVQYLSGPLLKLGFEEALLFSTTEHSTMLQATDLVVGASRNFLRASLLKEDYGVGLQMLRKIRNRFRGAPHQVLERGLNVSSGNGDFKALMDRAIRHELFEEPRPRSVPTPF